MIIGLLTMFRTLRSSYSLVHVVENQIKILLAHGHTVKLLVSESCPEEERYGVYLDERLDYIKVTNTIEGEPIVWHNYSDIDQELHVGFEKEVESVAEDLVKKLEGIEVCIMHDILYQGMHYLHNCAIRKAQKRLGGIGFISEIHSFPLIHPKVIPEAMKGYYMPMPNTLYVFPTRAGIAPLASQYNVPEGECRVVYHGITLIEQMSEVVRKIHQKYDLLSPDVLIVYPARLTPGKKLDKVVALAGALKLIGEVSIRIVFCDSTSKETDAEAYKESVREVADQYGVEENELIFTSEIGYSEGIPRESVLELFSLSNLYICPSLSEAFGLTVGEAARYGNLLVLNENVPALKEIGKSLGAYFMKWDARVGDTMKQEHYSPSEPTYYASQAKIILRKLREEHGIVAKTKVRQKFNNEWIWYHQLGPLLEEVKNKAK